MRKSYTIIKVKTNDSGNVTKVAKGNGHIVSRREVVSDIKNGAAVHTADGHGRKHHAEVGIYDRSFIRTYPDNKKCNNLKQLPEINGRSKK